MTAEKEEPSDVGRRVLKVPKCEECQWVNLYTDRLAVIIQVSEAIDSILLLLVYDVEIFLSHLYARMPHEGGNRLDVRSCSQNIYGEAVAGTVPCYGFIDACRLDPSLQTCDSCCAVAGDIEYLFGCMLCGLSYELQQCWT